MATSQREQKIGFLYALAACLLWGLVALYYRAIKEVAPIDILCHRVVWSVAMLAVILAVQRRWGELAIIVRSRRTMLLLAAAAVLVSTNWYLFIFAVDRQRLLYTSLGYFISPLLSVALGVVLLKEKLRPWQIAAIGLAIVGILPLARQADQMPWIALSLGLAMTFGVYGLLRKTIPAAPMIGLAVETAVLCPLALAVLCWRMPGEVGHYTLRTWLLLPLNGLITVLPLLWYTRAARRLKYSTLGFMQYITPSVSFLLAILIFKETLTSDRLLTFAIIWIALAIFSIDSLFAYRRQAGQLADPMG